MHIAGPAGPQQHHLKETSGGSPTRQTIRTIPELKRDSSREELASIALLAALELDDRPSFAIPAHADTCTDANIGLDLIYCNPALSKASDLLDNITGKHNTEGVFIGSTLIQQAFRKWLWDLADASDLAQRGKAYMFEGYIWTPVTVDGYKIVSGLRASLVWMDAPRGKQGADSIDPRERKSPRHMPLQGRPPALPSALSDPKSIKEQDENLNPRRSGGHGPYDVTLTNPPASILTSHIEYFRGIDWAHTTLGPMHSWTPELRNVVNMCLADIHPCVLFWGDEVVMIYNEAYIELIGILHPCIGQSAKVAASEYWHTFQPLVDHINATGRSVADTEIPVFIDRHGFLEETYWNFEMIPVLNKRGEVGGYCQVLFDTTKHVLLKRRVSSLVELGTQTANVRNTEDFWNLTQQTLTVNDKDVPFALLYSVEDNVRLEASTSSVNLPQLHDTFLLKGSIGVDPDHPISPSSLTIANESYMLHTHLLQAAMSKKATVIHVEELGPSRAELGNISWKGYGDPCRVIVVCPILPTEGEIEGFLILGINPRRPFDEDYQRFVQITLRLISTSLASVVLFNDELKQKEKAIDKAAKVEERLLAELQMKEKKFQRFAERSDVAIFILDAAGKYTYRNQRWYDMFNAAANEDDAMGVWLNIAFPEDIATCEAIFARLVMQKEAVSFELKTKMPWTPPSEPSDPEDAPVEHFKWILCSAYPEVDADGQIMEVVGNVTDISKQKWAEGIQKFRTDSALQSKQHLEHFIDTTSHEMRNPLSAIMQSADGIVSCISQQYDTSITAATWSSFIEQILDAAQTIAQCSLHMKHIVDDILTISKLDSGLLAITPVHVQAEGIGHHAVKMFEAEAKAADVTLDYTVDQAYHDMEIDWVSLDPTRLLQILINLLTNAIKFTRLEKTRRVSVIMSASSEPPVSVPGGVQFIEQRLVDEDQHLEADWKLDADLLYIQFSVTDTGRGLSEEERGSLFTRFSQASPRTHIHYGGTGLGLFIARRLTELQGGAIGLSSEVKKGSTFSFYIKTRRIQAGTVRKGSVPNILPEDIRHRPATPLASRTRLPPSHIPSHRGDDSVFGDPPSPRMARPSNLKRRPSLAYPDTEGHRLPSTPELQGQNQSRTSQDILHVLVVEDNLINQRVLAKQLRNLGCEVSVSNHGGEALEFLKKTVHWNHEHTETAKDVNSVRLSVILMDWEMPVMSGLIAVAKIREMEEEGVLKGRIPVIGVTANVRQQQIERAMTAGMDDVVAKPFRVAELYVRMRDVVSSVEKSAGDGAGTNGTSVEKIDQG